MMSFDQLPIPPEILPWLLPVSIWMSGVALSLYIGYLGSFWLVYSKAGRSGWLVLIPFINVIVLLRIVGRPAWHFLLLIVPFVNIYIFIVLWLDLARAFGKSTLFGVGLIFFNWIFVVILAFGSSEYLLRKRKQQVDEFQPINIRPV